MERLHRSQVAKGVFLLFAPFISSSLRTSYLYFLLNLLIEVGSLKAISRPHDEAKKQQLSNSKAAAAAPVTARQASAAKNTIVTTDSTAKPSDPALQKVALVRTQAKMPLKRCSSKPSLFFIGGWEGESASVIKEEEEEEREEKEAAHQGAELSKQELFKGRSFHWQLLHAAKDAEGGVMEEDSWTLSEGFLV